MFVKCGLMEICREKDCRHYELHETSPDCKLFCETMNTKTKCEKEEENAI